MPTVSFSMQGARLYMMNPNVSPHVAVVVPQLTGLDNLGGQKTSIPISNFDSADFMEFAGGLVDPGKPSGNIIVDMGSSGAALINTMLQQGTNYITQFFFGMADGTSPPTVVAGVLTPPSSGSPAVYSRSGWLFGGFVNEFTITGQVNNVLMAKFGIQATGRRDMIVKGATV